jgi:hypothetical protein
MMLRTLLLAALVAVPLGARANDSTAQLGAGGLVLVPNAGVTMVREDLFIAREGIRITYEFVNTTGKAITTLVAFPLPPLAGYDGDFQSTLPKADDAQNFVGFQVLVDGKPVTTQVDQRASIAGIDMTDALKADGVPINLFVTPAAEAMAKLPPERRRFYETRGMIIPSPDGKVEGLIWDVSTVFYWEQTFPPGRTVVVQHAYQPVVGQGLITEATLKEPAELERYRTSYCLDKATEAGLRKLIAARRKASKGEADSLLESRVDYILKTARNWGDSTIGTFKLTIEKPRPETLMSVCFTGALKKTSPTTFEFTAKDFTPDQDLSILFVSPDQDP